MIDWLRCLFGFHDDEPCVDARFNRCRRPRCGRRVKVI